MFSWDERYVLGVTQPQVHVGMVAVPAINPRSEATDFQNATAYWAIETEISIAIHYDSCYHHGALHTNRPNFYRKGYKKIYHYGNTHHHRRNISFSQDVQDIDFKTTNPSDTIDQRGVHMSSAYHQLGAVQFQGERKSTLSVDDIRTLRSGKQYTRGGSDNDGGITKRTMVRKSSDSSASGSRTNISSQQKAFNVGGESSNRSHVVSSDTGPYVLLSSGNI